MKYLLLMGLLMGCIVNDPLTDKKKAILLKNAKDFCSCHDGIRYIEFFDPDAIPDYAVVRCGFDARIIELDAIYYRCKSEATK